jgi:hypothetical protein
MVPSIRFSGRECRHADKIFAFPARTEFSVTTHITTDTIVDATILYAPASTKIDSSSSKLVSAAVTM